MDTFLRVTFGYIMEHYNFLKHHRMNQGITQGELAQAIGCSRAAISRWEGGSRDISMRWLLKIARALNLTLSELLEGVK